MLFFLWLWHWLAGPSLRSLEETRSAVKVPDTFCPIIINENQLSSIIIRNICCDSSYTYAIFIIGTYIFCLIIFFFQNVIVVYSNTDIIVSQGWFISVLVILVRVFNVMFSGDLMGRVLVSMETITTGKECNDFIFFIILLLLCCIFCMPRKVNK